MTSWPNTQGPIRQTGPEKLALVHGERVVEIGYGTGHGLVQMAEAVGPEGGVFRIDLSEGMQARARERLRGVGLIEGVELCRGDAAYLPYRESSMEAVLMSFTPVTLRYA